MTLMRLPGVAELSALVQHLQDEIWDIMRQTAHALSAERTSADAARHEIYCSVYLLY